MLSLKKLLLFSCLFILLNASYLTLAADNSVYINEDYIGTSEGEGEDNEINSEGKTEKAINPKNINHNFLKAYSMAKIIAVNKITAQSKEMILNIGESKYFGNIEIKVYKCYKNLNPYDPDNKILLRVIEEKVDEESTSLFQGWMMSSNVSISNFEHPVYEIFAKDCF